MPSTPAGQRLTGGAALVLGAVVSVQVGGALAAQLLPRAGVLGSVSLRVGIAALLLLLLTRPGLRGRTRGDWLMVAGFGVALAAMNATFYAALTRLPLGVAVTVEFLGPLMLAAVTSRRARDVAAVAGALGGVVLISRVATSGPQRLDLLGVALALGAGGCWACYIVASSAVGRRFVGLEGIALAMAVATVVVAPAAALTAQAPLLGPEILWRGAGIAILSSALPYSLELVALRRLPTAVFGVLMSLEPAVAALAGLTVLGQRLGPDQLLGMALVVAASATVLRAPAAGQD